MPRSVAVPVHVDHRCRTGGLMPVPTPPATSSTTAAIPLLELDTLRALWRRGGDDRVLAERLYELTGGVVA